MYGASIFEEAWLRVCSQDKKQWLSTKHRKARVWWCERYQHWTFQDWRKRIFSDELTFYVLKRENQVKIWRTDNERLLPDCIQQMNTGDGGKADISADGTIAAAIFEGTMNWTLYCDVLQQELIQSMEKLSNKSAYTFQQDLSSCHTSKLIQEKMAKLKVNVLEWPAKSSDLNPIEMFWSILDKKLAAKPIYSIMELRQRLEEEWNGIRQLSCLNLIDSTP